MAQIYVTGRSQRPVILGFYELEGDVDLYVIAENDAAGVRGHVPGEAEFLAVDLAADGEAGAGVTPGIFYDAAEFHFELYIFCDAVHREVAVDIVGTVIVDVLDPGDNEFDLRDVGGVEEGGGLYVAVALFLFRIDGGAVDGEGGLCGGEVITFRGDIGGEGREGAGHGGDHQVLYLEFDFRMRGVQYPFRCSHKDLF